MDIESFRLYCLSKKGVVEEFPFDESTLAFKVMGKIFAITDLEQFESVNLKCDPEKAVELRERYEGVRPGYHMNKKHWNTVLNHTDVNDKVFKELIDHSFDLVVNSLPKKMKEELNNLRP